MTPTHRIQITWIALLASVAAGGCGGSGNSTGAAGASNSGGYGASAGEDSGASGGSAGSGATGGSAGSGATGGSSGGAGLLSGCTVGADNRPSCAIPAGWTLADAQGFESGTYNSGESPAQAGNSVKITSAMGKGSAHSLDSYITGSFAGYGLKISGNVINSRDVYLSYWMYVTDSNPGYGYADTNWYHAVRVPQGESVGYGVDADVAPSGSCCLSTTGGAVIYGSIATPPPQPWSAWGSGYTYTPGAWQQFEFHLKMNDPGSSNGDLEDYVSGAKVLTCNSSNGCPSSSPGDLVGNTDYRTADLWVGGDWGKDVWWADAAHTVCSTQGDMGFGPDNVNMAACQCADQCPPNGKVPYFHIYIDDVIVLKK